MLSTGASMAGRLSDAAVYGKALTPSQVQTHFGAGTSCKSKVLLDVPTGYYRLGDAGTLVQDSSGNMDRTPPS
jgi:hypothetical protein